MNNRNPEHYPDPTARDALRSAGEEQARLNAAVKRIKSIAEQMGFDVVERIVLKDKLTGKLFR